MKILVIVALFPTLLVAGNLDVSPRERVSALVAQLQSERSATTFADFFTGSLMASQKEAQVRAIDSQAKGAFEFYGRPKILEIISEEELGNSLVRIKWLTKHTDEVPLFWNCLFYLRNGKWEPLSIVFYDSPQAAGI